MGFKTVFPCLDAVTLTQLNLSQINFCRQILDVGTNWHKFLIEDTYGFTRNSLLKIFLDHIIPFDLIPLCYTVDGNGAYFFARNCTHAVEKLCNDKLIIPNPVDDKNPFKLVIILKYTTTSNVKVDLSENLMKILKRRLKSQSLCLNNFSEDPEQTEYFSLSQPRVLAFVLNVAKSLKLNALKLCNNEIRTLDALKVLPQQSIVSLDLRNNLIKDLAELKYLGNFTITELWLEGNPVCELYDEHSYVQQVSQHCPKIEKLDGFLLRQGGVPSFRRNFLCDISSYDVVDQFLEQYFTTYDSKDWDKLESFYHNNAVFSMTAEYLQKQISSANSCMKSYKTYSRNLVYEPSGSCNLYSGRGDIIKLFDLLPNSEHDPYSFTVDVMQFTKKYTTIVVTGVFMEIPNVERLLGFNRSFVLEYCDDNYLIVNERLHVFNALTSQQVNAFKKPCAVPEARSETEQSHMLNTFSLITNLTKDWAKLFLEECRYNLKHALLLFIDLYKRDNIPSHGFKN